MKTFTEFLEETQKCWPGYKKKGTQKLFGKSYNRCVKEDIVSFAKGQEKKEKGIGPKPTRTPKELIDLAKKLEKGMNEENVPIGKRIAIELIKRNKKSPKYNEYIRLLKTSIEKSKEPKEDFEYELEESSFDKNQLLNALARRVHTASNRTERQKWKDIETKHRRRFTPPGKKLWRIGLTQAEREDANQEDYENLDTFGTKSTMDPGAGINRHITKNQRKLRKQKAMGEHPKEDFEYELEESSSGERTPKGRATLARGRGADMTSKERTSKVSPHTKKMVGKV